MRDEDYEREAISNEIEEGEKCCILSLFANYPFKIKEEK